MWNCSAQVKERVSVGAFVDIMVEALGECIVRKVREEVGMVKGDGAHCEKMP